MPCGDFWHWMGCRLDLGCSGSPPLLTSWQVAGHYGGFVDNTLVVGMNAMVALPWTCPRIKTLMSSAIYCISFPPDHAPVRVRGAVYRSRSATCGYPGALFMNLGTATVTAPGQFTFLDGDTGPMPTCELLWFMTWYEDDLHIGGLSDESGSRGAAWPVLQFRNPGDNQPFVGWCRTTDWQPQEDLAWPDPWPDLGRPVDWRGRADASSLPEDIIGLPALFCLFA